MEIRIIKTEESKWKFPCKGISVIDNKVVLFTKYGTGVVLDIGNSTCHKLYESSEYWIMTDFVPLKEDTQHIDWEKVELPVWVQNKDGNLIQITSIKGEEVVCYIIPNEILCLRHTFPTKGLAKECLNSLEVLPKGTKIEITI